MSLIHVLPCILVELHCAEAFGSVNFDHPVSSLVISSMFPDVFDCADVLQFGYWPIGKDVCNESGKGCVLEVQQLSFYSLRFRLAELYYDVFCNGVVVKGNNYPKLLGARRK